MTEGAASSPCHARSLQLESSVKMCSRLEALPFLPSPLSSFPLTGDTCRQESELELPAMCTRWRSDTGQCSDRSVVSGQGGHSLGRRLVSLGLKPKARAVPRAPGHRCQVGDQGLSIIHP